VKCVHRFPINAKLVTKSSFRRKMQM